jgi:ATP-binding cassette subfamily C protein
LPQRIDLFDGTVAENIARLTDSLDSNAVVAAAQLADIHDLISSLPDGYDTQVGAQGERLSAGQRQRIGLARALYGNPFLCVLDEPNANLDADGELALTSAIRRVRDRGGIAVVIAHRPSAIAAVDKLLFLKGSRQVAFGQKDEVLAQIRGENVRELKAATP